MEQDSTRRTSSKIVARSPRREFRFVPHPSDLAGATAIVCQTTGSEHKSSWQQSPAYAQRLRRYAAHMASSPLSSAGKLARDSVNLAVGGVTTSARLALKSEELLEETIATMRAARPVIDAVARALDDGLADDIRRLLSTAAQTQEDVRAAREAVERLVGIINSTLDGVGGVPGAHLVLKSLSRLTTPPRPTGPIAAGAGVARAGSAAARKVAPKKKPAEPRK